MGNPKAPAAIVEYGSLTCSHCRHFAETAMKPLVARYVRTGKASFEFRSLVLNGVDLAATLLARCAGPQRFFSIADTLYATQSAWLGRLTDDKLQRIQTLSQGDMMVAIAREAGLMVTAAGQGIGPAQAEACLRSEAGAERLMAMAQAAGSAGVTGTPTILVNGVRVAANDWATLEPFLKRSGG